ncbi:MAG: hypothetical protein ACFCBU_18840 [Cyanophyceae cyanobacterium]
MAPHRPSEIYTSMKILEQYLLDNGVDGFWFSINRLPVEDLTYVLLWDGERGKCYFPERGIEFDLVKSGDRRALVDAFIDMINRRLETPA